MRKLNEAEIREIQMQILDRVDEFCRTHNLRYSIAYGTLLGAVRHGGFIPWDDDIDIVMPRPDYERFLRTFNDAYSNLRVENHDSNPDYIRPFAKVFDDTTFAEGPNLIDDRKLFIDIFPIDGYPVENSDVICKRINQTVYDIGRAGKYWKYTNSPFQKAAFFLKYL